jgi:hypothetical protein
MRATKRKLNLSPLLLGISLVVAGTGFMAGCSDSQDDDDDLQSSNDNNNGDLGNDDAAEGNGQENFVDNDDKSGSKDSADVNSATTDAPATDAPNATLDGGGKDAAAANPAPVNAAPANATAGGAAPAAAGKGGGSDGSDKAPVQGGRVRYVKEGGVQVVNAPNGSPVMTLEQGEHPVTWEENGFLKISSGMYVPVDSLSDKGVARPMSSNRWAGDGGGSGGAAPAGDGGGAAPADGGGAKAKAAPAAH